MGLSKPLSLRKQIWNAAFIWQTHKVRGFPTSESLTCPLTLALEQLDRLTALKDDLARLEKPMTRWSNELVKITDGLDSTFTITCGTHKWAAANPTSPGSKRTEILRWISSEPYLQHHKRERDTFLEGTGKWLISHPLFRKWKDESASSLLWLHGIPGSGKSKLTCVICQI
jgi:hypothetical protein